MIISRTPYRISFFGGGTDYPGWYKVHGGQVLGTSIDKYCYITCRYLPPFFEHRYSIGYSKIENCNTIDEITHPAAREILRYLSFDRGVAIKHDGDLPARSGMGSSSSFAVGLLHALYALKGEMRSKYELAREAIYVEQQILKETVGSQDQTFAAVGGFNHIMFGQDEKITVRPVTIPQERMHELNDHLMLFYTGVARTADTVASSFVPTIQDREKELKALGQMVDQGIHILNSRNNIREFGALLDDAWRVKRELSHMVSNGHVDQLYQAARSVGAIGGKLLGAGGGGFLLLFVPPESQDRVRFALRAFLHVPFEFESSGSQIIFYEPGRDYSREEQIRAEQPLQAFRELLESGTREV